MKPSENWMRLWEKSRQKLKSPVDFNEYFTLPQIAGRELAVMDIGPVSIPTGDILVRDPLCYLEDRREEPYFQKVPVGTFRTEVCVVKPCTGDCARYAAVRVRFSETPAVEFEEALVGTENLEGLDEGEYFGFNVDAGLGCICDKAVQEAFCGFAERWYLEHFEGNLYDDYFAALFAQSYRERPMYQREGGDWLNWQVPGTEYHLPFFQSGFGDGVYPVYFGYDQEGRICQLVVQMIDLQLAYSSSKDAKNG